MTKQQHPTQATPTGPKPNRRPRQKCLTDDQYQELSRGPPEYKIVEDSFYNNPPEYLHSLPGLAKLFDVSEPTIYNWVATGHLPKPIKFGRKAYVRESDLQQKYAELADSFFEGNESHAMAQNAARLRYSGKSAA